jgi:predicted Zn finger-like uncharacterized protein
MSGMDDVRCPKCGAVYRLARQSPEPDGGVLRCEFCGELLVTWDGGGFMHFAVQALARERAAFIGRRKQGATHGGRYIVHRVFRDGRVRALRADVSSPEALETIAAVTAEHMELVVSHLERASGYLQVLFKNTDRVRQLDQDLAKPGESASLPPLPTPTAQSSLPTLSGQRGLFEADADPPPHT